MAGVGCARPVHGAEDIRDLQGRARHQRRASGGRSNLGELQRDMLQRADDLLDRLGGHPRIERRAVEFGVTEQNLDDTDIHVLLQQMGGEAVPQDVRGHVALDSGRLCAAAWQARLSWRVVIGLTGF